MDYEELLKKLGFARCGDTQIFQISLGGSVGLHLEAANTMTVLELRDHLSTQLEVLRKNLNMHIDGTITQLERMTKPGYLDASKLEKYSEDVQ